MTSRILVDTVNVKCFNTRFCSTANVFLFFYRDMNRTADVVRLQANTLVTVHESTFQKGTR